MTGSCELSRGCEKRCRIVDVNMASFTALRVLKNENEVLKDIKKALNDQLKRLQVPYYRSQKPTTFTGRFAFRDIKYKISKYQI